ncbi:MAG: hypothetical protein M3119_03195 [Verrucomicrobiota bacterium]|nr:hypothetical protein [Verrucomicrobiota bacterium]
MRSKSYTPDQIAAAIGTLFVRPPTVVALSYKLAHRCEHPRIPRRLPNEWCCRSICWRS